MKEVINIKVTDMTELCEAFFCNSEATKAVEVYGAMFNVCDHHERVK